MFASDLGMAESGSLRDGEIDGVIRLLRKAVKMKHFLHPETYFMPVMTVSITELRICLQQFLRQGEAVVTPALGFT